jgi:hypothetical protein
MAKEETKKAKIEKLKAKACDMFTQDLKLKSAIQQNATALQNTLNEIAKLEAE